MHAALINLSWIYLPSSILGNTSSKSSERLCEGLKPPKVNRIRRPVDFTYDLIERIYTLYDVYVRRIVISIRILYCTCRFGKTIVYPNIIRNTTVRWQLTFTWSTSGHTKLIYIPEILYCTYTIIFFLPFSFHSMEKFDCSIVMSVIREYRWKLVSDVIKVEFSIRIVLTVRD